MAGALADPQPKPSGMPGWLASGAMRVSLRNTSPKRTGWDLSGRLFPSTPQAWDRMLRRGVPRGPGCISEVKVWAGEGQG